jgi:hypothetical protein
VHFGLLAPFLGARAARRELVRPVEATPTLVEHRASLQALRDSGAACRRAAQKKYGAKKKKK